jgi:hypothetical protein
MEKPNAFVKCPHCETVAIVEMPSTLSVVRMRCPECEETILPLSGDCCVFCSHADTKCPPAQQEARGDWFLSSPLHLREGEGPDGEGVACYMEG